MVEICDSVKENLIGNTFGNLTVIEYVGRDKYYANVWKARCTCGKEVIYTTRQIKSRLRGCKACRRESDPTIVARRTELLGVKFGRLTVEAFHGKDKKGALRWRCRCDCGNESLVSTGSLNNGTIRSCGCLKVDAAREANRTHGLSKHLLYSVWAVMKDRCYNSRNESYVRYGERGIQVHEEWVKDFKAFYDWAMANGYKEGLTIDRIDNDGNYEPGNCRWVTQDIQNQNQGRTKLNLELVVKVRDDPRSHRAISEEYGVAESTVSRIKAYKIWKNAA